MRSTVSVYGTTQVKVYRSRLTVVPRAIVIFRWLRRFCESNVTIEFFVLTPGFPRAMQSIRGNSLRKSKPLSDDFHFYASLEQIGGKRVAQCVRACPGFARLSEPGCIDQRVDGPEHRCLMHGTSRRRSGKNQFAR